MLKGGLEAGIGGRMIGWGCQNPRPHPQHLQGALWHSGHVGIGRPVPEDCLLLLWGVPKGERTVIKGAAIAVQAQWRLLQQDRLESRSLIFDYPDTAQFEYQT